MKKNSFVFPALIGKAGLVNAGEKPIHLGDTYLPQCVLFTETKPNDNT